MPKVCKISPKNLYETHLKKSMLFFYYYVLFKPTLPFQQYIWKIPFHIDFFLWKTCDFPIDWFSFISAHHSSLNHYPFPIFPLFEIWAAKKRRKTASFFQLQVEIRNLTKRKGSHIVNKTKESGTRRSGREIFMDFGL